MQSEYGCHGDAVFLTALELTLLKWNRLHKGKGNEDPDLSSAGKNGFVILGT